MNTINEVREMRVKMLKKLAHLQLTHNSDDESLIETLAQFYDTASTNLMHNSQAMHAVNIARTFLEPIRLPRRITRHHRVFCIFNGSELHPDYGWQGFQLVTHHTLHHLTLCIDFRPRQLDLLSTTTMEPTDLPAKLRTFGFKMGIVNNDKTTMPSQITFPYQQHDATTLDILASAQESYLTDLLYQHQLYLLPEIQLELEKVITDLEAEYV